MIIPLKNTIPLSDRSTCIVSYDALLHSRRKLDDDLYPTNPWSHFNTNIGLKNNRYKYLI